MKRPITLTIWKPDGNIKLYSYRWIIITIFALYSGVNYFQFMQFTIIANIVQKYYEVEALYVDMTGLVYMAFYILLFIPAGYFVEKNSLKSTSIICSGLTALANCLKMFATLPDKYYIVLIAQSMCAMAQTFMLIIPTKVACTWFGAKEVSTACSVGVFGNEIGLALGSILPTLVVNDSDNKDIVQEGLQTMFIYNALVSVAIFVIVIIFFRSKPPSPPSESQAELISKSDKEKITYCMALKGFAQNRDFIIVLCTLGLAFGYWTCTGVLVNQIFSYSFPNESNSLSGFLTSASIITGGCFGSVIFGYLLDKTHNFKWTSFFALSANTLTTLILGVLMLSSNKIGTCIVMPINGFFSGSLMVIAYEYAAETTYPTPDAFGASILNVFIYLSAIVYVIVLSILFESVGYLVGYIVIVVSLTVGTLPVLLMSTELKRRNANLKT